MVEDLALASGGRGDEVLVQDVEDVLADLGELGLDLLAVGLDHRDLGLVALGLLLLLDGGDDAPRGTAGTNDVLVGDREKVALLDGELLPLCALTNGPGWQAGPLVSGRGCTAPGAPSRSRDGFDLFSEK